MLEGLRQARRCAGAATTTCAARRGARLLIAALVLGCAPVALCAPLPAAARAEVMALLDRLAASGCRFQRNGSWHAGAEARDHLLQKLEYVEKHASATTAEQFIDLAAARSSISGKPYQVQCADAGPVPSAAWLTRELRALRASKPSVPK